MKRLLLLSNSTLALVLALSAPAVLAQTVTNVVNFNGANGASPFIVTLAQGRDGKLYGTTYSGGANGLGAVVRINLSTGSSVVLHSFDGTNGSYPGAGLTLATDGNYYGTTVYGGSADIGVLYKITAAGTYTVLHQFTGGSDGSYPYGPPIEARDGSLYGTTSGVPNSNASTIYKLTRSGSYSVVYTFDQVTSGNSAYGLTQGSDGLLYAAPDIGGADGCGTIVKVTILGVLKATHPFTCRNGGAQPVGIPAQASDGNYYGTTLVGGTGGGVLYKLTPAFGVSILHDFSGTDVKPQGTLVQGTDSNLYGTSESALYSWSLSGAYSTLYTFTVNPFNSGGLVQHTNGLFYGAASSAGAYSLGFIYSLNMGLGPFVTFVHAQGKIGATAQILGQGLTGTTSVTFNGIAASFAVVSDTYLSAVVPSGAATGPVVVTTPGGTLTSNKNFTVSP
jgi:uncharacterized repeat protein (TIGR03803 family)